MTVGRTDRDPGATLRVVVLAGGYGGAKLSHGLAMLGAAATTDPAAASGAELDLSIIANTGDDLELHGLLVCPDLDTILYTLAGLANEATGWGVRDETWSAKEMLERLGQETWVGPPERIAERWRPYAELGVSLVIADLPAPYDRETIERWPEVRTLMAGA